MCVCYHYIYIDVSIQVIPKDVAEKLVSFQTNLIFDGVVVFVVNVVNYVVVITGV